MEKEYHLSFPNIFRGGKSAASWYMVPESHENSTIDLYHSVEFPYTWEHEATLIGGVRAVDTVVFYHNSKWWLFTSLDTETTPLNANLSVFYSDVFPSTDWKAHPQNPVVSGLSNSRMAGAIFRDRGSGALIRPAQNCLKDYGKETNLNEIVELSPSGYRERIIKTISPEKSLHAVCTHTINISEHFMLRDIKTRRSRFIRGEAHTPPPPRPLALPVMEERQ
jgi:hypothetical protein